MKKFNWEFSDNLGIFSALTINLVSAFFYSAISQEIIYYLENNLLPKIFPVYQKYDLLNWLLRVSNLLLNSKVSIKVLSCK